MKKIPILFLGLLGGLAACTRIPPAIAPDKKIETRIGELLQKMTLEEKIGQLNLPSAGDITTGQAKSSDIARSTRC